jgi:hypothetical protein
MPKSQSGSKSRHVQFFRDDQQEEGGLAGIDNENKWLNGFLSRLANVVQNIAKENKGASRPDGGA